MTVNLRAAAALCLAASLLTVGGCTSSEPTCDDVASLWEDSEQAGAKDFNEASMNELVEAEKQLELAVADCEEKGESPQYAPY